MDLVSRQIVKLAHASTSEEYNLHRCSRYDYDDHDDFDDFDDDFDDFDDDFDDFDDDFYDEDFVTMMFVTLPVRLAPLGMPMAISG